MGEIVVVDAGFRLSISIRSADIRDRNLKLSEIAPNFGRFLSPKILGAQAPKHLYPSYHARHAAHHVVTFSGVIRTDPKVISQRGPKYTEFWGNFQIFNVKNVVGGIPAPVPTMSRALASLGQYVARVKIGGQHPLRGEIMSSQKVDFGWVNISRVDFVVSGPNKVHHFFPTWEGL